MNIVNVDLHCVRCFSKKVGTDGYDIKCLDDGCGYETTRKKFMEIVAEMSPFKPVQVNVTLLPGQSGKFKKPVE